MVLVMMEVLDLPTAFVNVALIVPTAENAKNVRDHPYQGLIVTRAYPLKT